MLGLCFANTALGQAISTQSKVSLKQHTNEEIAALAQQWDITEREYRRYQQVMAGKRGTWTTNADPILALGVSARNVKEMRDYAEKYVMQEFERTERELAFQREVSAAWQRLFPQQQRIGKLPPSVSTATALKRAQHSSNIERRAAVVVTQDCEKCIPVISKYTQLVTGEGALVAVDFYIGDSDGNDATLKAWVDRNNIPLTLLKAGKLTVNHATTHSGIKKYPTIYERRDGGQWVEKVSP